MTDKKELWDQWSYEFREWIPTMQSAPVRLVISEDKSESYEMERFHVFELENGQFATVYECGCSCYSSSDAKIELYPTVGPAVEKFYEWKKNIETRGY